MMYPNAIIVTITESGNYLAVQTLDKKWKRSQRFFISREGLSKVLYATESEVTEFDIGSFCRIRMEDEDNLRLVFYWLRSGISETLSGHVQSVSIPKGIIYRALDLDDDESIRIVNLDPDERPHSRIEISEGAHQKIATMDKATRRAFSKALARNFYWRTPVTIYPDWGASMFMFSTQGMWGGFVRHTRNKVGKDGVTRSYPVFEIHT